MPIDSASSTRCRGCGGALPAGWSAAACPRCLVRISVESPESPPLLLGDYELVEEIARGGMGVVYRARQRKLNRTVAVKVLAAGDFASAGAQRRFRVEAEAAARLQHPGIVAIHDVGETDGLPWLSMDWVAGPNLAALVREQPLPGREAAEYVRAIAEAVQHAHDHGVLHRDLKPSNVLLDPETGPRVTDFGIARCADADEHTRTGEVAGSPGYTAPEQAFAGRADARTDVYGLGALLYHLLTARPPFQGPTLDAILLQLREADPLPPRRLNPAVPRDLETICLRCLRKEPAQRYATAREVADDIARFQRGEAIHARPAGAAERLARLIRRRPALAGLTVALAAAVVALGINIAVSRNATLAAEKHRAEFAERLAREQRRTALLARARLQMNAHDAGRRNESLRLLREAWSLGPSPEIRSAAITALTLADLEKSSVPAGLEFPEPATAPPGDGSLATRVVQRAFHPASQRLALAGADRLIYLLDSASGEVIRRLRGHEGACLSLAFSPDGLWLATASDDQTVRLWDACSGEELVLFERKLGHDATQLRWSRDGAWLRVTAAETLRFLPPEAVTLFTSEHDVARAEEVRTIDLSADGRWLVTGDERGTHLWNCATRRVVASFPKDRGEWAAARFSPDSRRLWIGGWNSALRAVDLPAEQTAAIPEPAFVAKLAGALIAASDDGTRLAAVSNDGGGFQLRNAPPPHRAVWLRHAHPLDLALSRDGNLAATSSFDAPGAQVWDLPAARPLRRIAAAPASLLAFAPDNQWLATGAGREVTIWNASTGEVRQMIAAPARIKALAFSADGRFLAIETPHGVGLHRGTAPFEKIAQLLLESPRGAASFCFSRDSRQLAIQSSTGGALVWQLDHLHRELTALGMSWDRPLRAAKGE